MIIYQIPPGLIEMVKFHPNNFVTLCASVGSKSMNSMMQHGRFTTINHFRETLQSRLEVIIGASSEGERGLLQMAGFLRRFTRFALALSLQQQPCTCCVGEVVVRRRRRQRRLPGLGRDELKPP